MMRLPADTGEARARIAFWALAGVALLASHDAVFLAQLGPGEAFVRTLRGAAHDYWGVASIGLTVVGAASALVVAVRMLRLRRKADALGIGALPLDRRSYRRRAVSSWLALFAIVSIGFLIQENVEHALGHTHLLGVGALVGPEYPLALPVIGLIAFVAALVAAAVGGAEQALLAAIAGMLRSIRLRPPSRLARAPLRLSPPRRRPLAGSSAGRAPPSRLVSIT